MIAAGQGGAARHGRPRGYRKLGRRTDRTGTSPGGNAPQRSVADRALGSGLGASGRRPQRAFGKLTHLNLVGNGLTCVHVPARASATMNP
jgi:hypothetical protein